MKLIYTTLLLLSCILTMHSQILFQENFESGDAPDWAIQTDANDGGWLIGTPSQLSSAYFNIPSNGSSRIAATNDDACDCDKSNELFITPAIDLSGQSAALLRFDAFYLDNTIQGQQEDASIRISTDGVNFELIKDLDGEAEWQEYLIDLTDYAGESTVYIAFRFDDGGGWLYGFCIDNVVVEVPAALDVELFSFNSAKFGEVEKDFPIEGILVNLGVNTITDMEIQYTIDGGAPVIETIENLNIEAFESHHFHAPTDWLPEEAGLFMVDLEIVKVNGVEDENLDNNSGGNEVEIFNQVVVPNKMDDFLASEPILTEIEGASNWLNRPTDLDFFPILGKNELWVINQRTENAGGSTVKISDATDEIPSEFLHQVDGNSWHFMSLPTAIAFSSENFNFANSPGVQDANHGGGTFTGPTLWSSDPDIYAQPSGGNGSHLDMLHGSPFSMGIAHEVDNAFWVYDDWNQDIVRYDFVDDHGPGADDHSDAIVRRYQDIGINADTDIPNHMILDKESGWLYFVDNGNDRIVRLDINSGGVSNSLPLINEQLAEHSKMGNFTVEVIIEDGLDRPCGIEIFEGKLLVGDYANGDIIVYDMDLDFAEMGRIPTGSQGLTGIKVGPDGNIWYTNRLLNTLMTAEPGLATGLTQALTNVKIDLIPNPASDKLSISVANHRNQEPVKATITSLQGVSMGSYKDLILPTVIDVSNFPEGIYLLSLNGDKMNATKKFTIHK